MLYKARKGKFDHHCYNYYLWLQRERKIQTRQLRFISKLVLVNQYKATFCLSFSILVLSCFTLIWLFLWNYSLDVLLNPHKAILWKFCKPFLYFLHLSSAAALLSLPPSTAVHKWHWQRKIWEFKVFSILAKWHRSLVFGTTINRV